MVTNQTHTTIPNWQIAAGMTVYGSDGDKLGTVRNYDREAGWLDIQKGWLFQKDFYVGMVAITAVDEQGITLRLTKQDLDDDRYGSPPVAGEVEHVILAESTVSDEAEPLLVEHELVPGVLTH